MSEFFLKILNMSISATWMVLAVLVLRLCLKKAPKWVNVLLWGIVAARLLCPFSIESALSLIPSAETISPDIMMDRTPEIDSGISSINGVVNPFIAAHFTPEPMWSANPLQIWIAVAARLWFLGVVVMAVYMAVSYLRLRRQVGGAAHLYDNIYRSAGIPSPFVLGIFRPRIYLPDRMDEGDKSYVIAHEQTHIRRRDHWWKPLGYLLLTLHWFNPILWIAYILLCRDIELACDEKVIRELGRDQRADYSEALLSCSVDRRMIAACPLAFGEVGVQVRVKNVLRYKKPAFWVIVLAVILCALLAMSMLTDPVEKTTPHAVFSTLERSDVQWAQATIWNKPAGDHIMLDDDQTDELVSILKSIEDDDYEERVYVDNGISIMIYCGDREILLKASEEYVCFSFDTETAALTDNTAWGVKNDALNHFIAKIWNMQENESLYGIFGSYLYVPIDGEVCCYEWERTSGYPNNAELLYSFTQADWEGDILWEVYGLQNDPDRSRVLLRSDTGLTVQCRRTTERVKADEDLIRAWSMDQIIVEDSRMTNGADDWERFYTATCSGIPGSVTIIQYNAVSPDGIDNGGYGMYPMLRRYDISFDGRSYTVESDGRTHTYSHLSTYTNRNGLGYFLAQDGSVTMEEIFESLHDGPEIDHFLICSRTE